MCTYVYHIQETEVVGKHKTFYLSGIGQVV